METYFTENCDLHEEEYVYSDMNIHINNPIFCYNNITLDGNVSLNSNLGSLMNINVTGEVKNANTSVVYSKYGDITIENDSTANINGLIYVPLGTLTINSPNINLNGVIIADKIVINGSSVNINYKDDIAQFIGNTSEVYDFSGLEYLPEEWLGDTDEDELFDIYEKVIDTDPFDSDTDDDGLPDGYEVITLNTDPLEIDTDENGISDADEDFDSDNLSNLGEYNHGTEPFNPDTDEDGFMDGDEVYTYGTEPLNLDTDNDGQLDGEESYDGSIYAKYGVYFDPLNPDTNGNGILDGDEVFGQSKQQEVSTHDEAITEIKVDMTTNGNLDRNLTVESMYNVDAMSTNVYSLIGEPFNFTSATDFESATITFKVDKSKLGDTKFDNLLILWYDEENQIFKEMETIHDEANSTVSTTTTHFSQYMIVDSEKWFDHWEESFVQLRKMWSGNTSYYKALNTILIVDCSWKMEYADPINYDSIEIGYNGVTEKNHQSIRDDMPGDINYYYEHFGRRKCNRAYICENIINNLSSGDRAMIMNYSNGIENNTGWSSNWDYLMNGGTSKSCGIQRVNNNGGTLYLSDAVSAALSYVTHDVENTYRIVIITSGSVNYGSSLSAFDYSNVSLNIVSLGGGTISSGIESIANSTGEDVYYGYPTSSLTGASGGSVYIPPEFKGEDYDKDGIPDMVELYGLKPNGEPINSDPKSKHSDNDGLEDNQELHFSAAKMTYELDKSQYDGSVFVWSDPCLDDTDDDGLNDGKRQFYNGKVLLPIDPNPLICDGPKGVWKAQKRMMESGNIPTAYTSNPTGTNAMMNEMAKNADALVDTLLNAKVIANEYIIEAVEYLFKDSAENRPAAISGADFLDFIYDEYNMAYHSQPDNWQKAFGYNDIYDRVFEYGSNMKKNRIKFEYNGESYILWPWKGDYWNLQSGAETGLYVYNRTVNGVDHYDVVDFNLPMTLSLYNLYDEYAENVFSWVPNEPQWWITGFNPEFTEPNPNTMAMICSVDFENENLYNSFKETHQSENEHLIFDKDYNTVWIIW